MGILAALRSQARAGLAIGVMATASHNPAGENGVKIVDPHGEMMSPAWELYATEFANADSSERLCDLVERVVETLKLDTSVPARVLFARDTRPSGARLVAALVAGLQAVGTEHVDFGTLTTPQLHYMVLAYNTFRTPSQHGEPSETGYYTKLSSAFRRLMESRPKPGPLVVDCAHGVGALKLKLLSDAIGEEIIDISLVNTDVDAPAKLNHLCGADYVKTYQRLPPNMQISPRDRCASLDGDADRLVYYFVDGDGMFHLLDGDKIAVLAALYFKELIRTCGIALTIGVVQTAYANGNATSFIAKTLKLPIACVPTGVKHLHHAAQQYQIGIYFEANGHGTVLFSPDAMLAIASYEPSSPAQRSALEQLHHMTELINQTVGDALSDLLLVEAILAYKGWELGEWDSLYTDLPNRLVKVIVPDRTIFHTEDAERRIVTPFGMQDKLDALIAKYTDGRAFVRASGTENAVRAYAEAATRGEADELALRCSSLIEEAAAATL